MELKRFTLERAGNPYAISAESLDYNFSRLVPLKQDGNAPQYSVTETPNGWSLNIFPPYPSGSGTYVLGFTRGGLAWIATEAC